MFLEFPMDKTSILNIWSLINCTIIVLSLIIFSFLDYYFYKKGKIYLLKDKIRLIIHSLIVGSYFLLYAYSPEKLTNLFLSLIWVCCIIFGINDYFASKKTSIRRMQLERGLTEEQIETSNKLMKEGKVHK